MIWYDVVWYGMVFYANKVKVRIGTGVWEGDVDQHCEGLLGYCLCVLCCKPSEDISM